MNGWRSTRRAVVNAVPDSRCTYSQHACGDQSQLPAFGSKPLPLTHRGFDAGQPPGLRVPLQPLQIGAHVSGVLIAHVAIFLQRLGDDLFQFQSDLRLDLSTWHRLAVQDGVKDQPRRAARKRVLAGGHLVEYSTEGE